MIKQLKIDITNQIKKLIIECWTCRGIVVFKLAMAHPKLINSPLGPNDIRTIGFSSTMTTCTCLEKSYK